MIDKYLKQQQKEIQKVMNTITDIYHGNYEYYSKPL